MLTNCCLFVYLLSMIMITLQAAETDNGEQYGLWHVLTNCFPPSGTVGQAYLGTTCTSYNVGWDTYGSGTWATFAHEVGHNFGGEHTMNTGGIMSYDNAKELKFSGDNPYQICSHVQSKANSVQGGVQCYQNFGSTCGNDILEPGEECDGDSCCEAGTCTFVSTAYCSHQYKVLKQDGGKTLVTNECCDSTCKPTGTNLCNAGSGFCVSGACQVAARVVEGTGSWCYYGNLLPCRSGTTKPGDSPDPCSVSCAYDSNPTQCTPFSFSGSAQTFPEGSICSNTPFATCQGGVCTAAVDPKASGGGGGGGGLTYSLTFTSPSSGTVWTAGTTNAIEWANSNVPASTTVTLTLQTPAGSNVLPSVTTNNDGSHSFALTQLLSAGSYRICISSPSPTAASDCSDTFSIIAAPSIVSVSHAPSSTVALGSTLTVSWATSGAINNVKITLLRNGNFDRTIKNSVAASTQLFQWTVPSAGLTTGENLFSVKVQDKSNSAIQKTSTGTFTISSAPSITVVGPSSSTQWTKGATASIIWSSTGITGTVSVKLYRDSLGEVGTLSSAAQASAGTLAVTTVQTSNLAVASDYYVQVRDTATGSIAGEGPSNGRFEVLSAGSEPAGTIAVDAPISCQAGGVACTVSWTPSFSSGGAPSKVLVKYAGASAGVIAAEVLFGTTTYAWSIPSSVAGGTFYVTVESIGISPTVIGTSSSFEILSGPSVKVSQPSESETWTTGRTVTVTWVGENLGSTGKLNNVNIALVDANGNVFSSPLLGSSVTSSATGGSKADIVVPASVNAGSGYNVRVTSTTDATLFGISNSFTIAKSATLFVSSPAKSTRWSRGATVPLRWETSGTVESVRLELVDSTGATVQIIANPWKTSLGKNAFNFNIPKLTAIADEYRIKITSLSDALTASTSEMFSIVARPYVDITKPLSGQSIQIGETNGIEWLDATSTIAGGKVNVELYRSGVSVHVIEGSPVDNNGLVTFYADPTKLDVNGFEGTGYSVVVSNPSATSSSSSTKTLYAVIGNYPGTKDARIGNGAYVLVEGPSATASNKGSTLTVVHGLRFVRNARQGDSGGLHVHTGTSCSHGPEAVGGHMYETAEDPWSTTRWAVTDNSFQVSGGGLPSLDDLEGRTVVVHSEAGVRIGCGVLRAKVHGISAPFSMERVTELSVDNATTLAPHGSGSSVTRGQAMLVHWTTHGSVKTVQVKISTVIGAAEITLASSLPNTGESLVIIPFAAIVDQEYEFVVSSAGARSKSGGKFTVVASTTETTPPSVSIMCPSNVLNEYGIRYNEPFRIVWNFNDATVATHVSIGLSFNGSAPVVLVAKTENDGAWSWTPSLTDGGVVQSTRHALHVTPIDAQGKVLGAVSLSNEFAVLPPQPALSMKELSGAHNARTKGGTDGLQWTSVGGKERLGSVDLTLLECHDLYCDEHSVVGLKIGTTTSNALNQYDWNIPLLSPPITNVDYAIQISSSLHPFSVMSISERFTMKDFSCDSTNQGIGCPDERRYEITSPKTGTTWIRGKRIDIQWSLTGKNQQDEWIEESVMLILYGNAKTPVYQIATQIDNTGTYHWFVPLDLPVGDAYVVHIYPVDRKTTDSQRGIFQYRSTCPTQSLANFKCESAAFSIKDAPSSSITVRLNDGGADGSDSLTLVHDETYTVIWEALGTSSNSGTVTISLVQAAALTSSDVIVCKNQPASGTCMWKVPNTISAIDYPKATYTIRAILFSNDGTTTVLSSVSVDTYRVALKTSMNITRPYKNSVMEKGSTYNIMFDYTGVPFATDIFLYAGSKSERVVVGGRKKCIFPFVYLGRIHMDCVRESASTRFLGQEWCPTSVDKDLNPMTRGVCESLLLIKQIPMEEISIYDSNQQLANQTLPSIPIEVGYIRWKTSEMSLPAQGEQYHVVLSSTLDRTVIGASNTFTILCTSYSIQVQLLPGSQQPSVEVVQKDLSSNLNVPPSSIRMVIISGNPIAISFEVHSQVRTVCPIEAFGTLLRLWSTQTGTGFLKDMDTTVVPSKSRIDKSDAHPGVDIVVSN